VALPMGAAAVSTNTLVIWLTTFAICALLISAALWVGS
jgi:hypothetical protein